jgi:hypothetical protein
MVAAREVAADIRSQQAAGPTGPRDFSEIGAALSS